ncbi:MAG TPA: hypothetical protein VG963_21115, partial [Polyangiaceae bacterium]|nr:hypothetical protein [Polyangiaceae bacterium]
MPAEPNNESLRDQLPVTELRVDPVDRKLMSGFRIQVAFMLFTGFVVCVLTLLAFVFVSHIFQQLTPAIRADLENKAVRGSRELARSVDLGLVIKDVKQIQDNLGGYDRDVDVLAIVATDPDGGLIASFGSSPLPLSQLFSGAPAELHEAAG